VSPIAGEADFGGQAWIDAVAPELIILLIVTARPDSTHLGTS